mmetsp:Transcript_843/g.2889  ORF Transcript_843/g.2889 Transcript_843/m.2889 type:complete len:239 (-) Transcript_843:301-1017(-)
MDMMCDCVAARVRVRIPSRSFIFTYFSSFRKLKTTLKALAKRLLVYKTAIASSSAGKTPVSIAATSTVEESARHAHRRDNVTKKVTRLAASSTFQRSKRNGNHCPVRQRNCFQSRKNFAKKKKTPSRITTSKTVRSTKSLLHTSKTRETYRGVHEPPTVTSSRKDTRWNVSVGLLRSMYSIATKRVASCASSESHCDPSGEMYAKPRSTSTVMFRDSRMSRSWADCCGKMMSLSSRID